LLIRLLPKDWRRFKSKVAMHMWQKGSTGLKSSFTFIGID
jgi:hypothetical protein